MSALCKLGWYPHLPRRQQQRWCIISIGDVVKNRLDELETETNVMRDYIVARG